MNIIRLNSIGEPFAKSGQATPPSGGGTETSSMEYYSMEPFKENNRLQGAYLIMFSALAKLEQDGVKIVLPSLMAQSYSSNDFSPLAVSIITDALVVDKTQEGTIKETLYANIPNDLLEAARITKEQFYTL